MVSNETPELSLLAVDDDAVSLLVAEHILASEGHAVTTATSVAEAVALIVADSASFDVIVCDYFMPEETGLDLLTRLDDLDIWIPILLLTGVSDESDLGDERSKLVAGFLTKPVQSAELLAAVQSVAGVNRGCVSPRTA